MAEEESSPTSKGNGPRRGRPPKGEGRTRGGRDEPESGQPAVATAEPDAVAEPMAESGPVPEEMREAPAAPPAVPTDAEGDRLDLAALKEMSATKLAQVAKGLEIPGAAAMK